jgi:hypothetical protein
VFCSIEFSLREFVKELSLASKIIAGLRSNIVLLQREKQNDIDRLIEKATFSYVDEMKEIENLYLKLFENLCLEVEFLTE